MKEIYLLLGLVILISISECLGQSCLKKYHHEPNKTYLYFLAVVFYSIVCLLLVLSYKFKGMGMVNVLWSGLSVLFIVSVGMIFFQETITRMDFLGLILIILGITCVLWEGSHGE